MRLMCSGVILLPLSFECVHHKFLGKIVNDIKLLSKIFSGCEQLNLDHEISICTEQKS